MRSIIILGKTWKLGHVLEREGEAIFGLYLFLKRKEEGKLEQCLKRLRYGYLSKFGMDSPIFLLGTLLTPSLIVFGLIKP